MIYFQTKPDSVFSAILEEALQSGLAEATLIAQEEDCESWEGLFPVCANWFTPQMAVLAVKQLLQACQDPRVYRIPDTYWLLVYECLSTFCAAHNDFIEDEREAQKTVGPFRLGYLDCGSMVQIYFWDTDFLMHANSNITLALCPCDDQMETERTKDEENGWPPVMGKLEPVEEVLWRVEAPDEFFHSESDQYPDQEQ